LLIRETDMGADLELVVGGRPVRFPAVWLRDNCPCPGCVAPGTGQKLNDITDIPNGLAITRTEDAGESVLVTFGPDQHRSAFPRSRPRPCCTTSGICAARPTPGTAPGERSG
jgi:hypothetical protein